MSHFKKLTKMKKKIFYSLLFLGSIALVKGCTKLNEEILDEASVAGLTNKQLPKEPLHQLTGCCPLFSSILTISHCRKFLPMKPFFLIAVEPIGVITVFIFHCTSM